MFAVIRKVMCCSIVWFKFKTEKLFVFVVLSIIQSFFDLFELFDIPGDLCFEVMFCVNSESTVCFSKRGCFSSKSADCWNCLFLFKRYGRFEWIVLNKKSVILEILGCLYDKTSF